MPGDNGDAEIPITAFPGIGFWIFIRQKTLAERAVQIPNVGGFQGRSGAVIQTLNTLLVDRP
jgi:hypothetical protein